MFHHSNKVLLQLGRHWVQMSTDPLMQRSGHIRAAPDCTQGLHSGFTLGVYTQGLHSGFTLGVYTQGLHSGFNVSSCEGCLIWSVSHQAAENKTTPADQTEISSMDHPPPPRFPSDHWIVFIKSRSLGFSSSTDALLFWPGTICSCLVCFPLSMFLVSK